jgi:hypothetical protein
LVQAHVAFGTPPQIPADVYGHPIEPGSKLLLVIKAPQHPMRPDKHFLSSIFGIFTIQQKPLRHAQDQPLVQSDDPFKRGRIARLRIAYKLAK